MSEIHSPVPGFNPTVHNLVTKVFDVIKASQPFWRANFVITPWEGVCPFEEEILHSEASSTVIKERRREVMVLIITISHHCAGYLSKDFILYHRLATMIMI